MRKQVKEDERVLAQKRKIGNDAFQILLYGLIAVILIQAYLFNAPFSQYARNNLCCYFSYLLFGSQY